MALFTYNSKKGNSNYDNIRWFNSISKRLDLIEKSIDNINNTLRGDITQKHS